jgi:hypothetical protein
LIVGCSGGDGASWKLAPRSIGCQRFSTRQDQPRKRWGMPGDSSKRNSWGERIWKVGPSCAGHAEHDRMRRSAWHDQGRSRSARPDQRRLNSLATSRIGEGCRGARFHRASFWRIRGKLETCPTINRLLTLSADIEREGTCRIEVIDQVLEIFRAFTVCAFGLVEHCF